jgi:hypothetical protein
MQQHSSMAHSSMQQHTMQLNIAHHGIGTAQHNTQHTIPLTEIAVMPPFAGHVPAQELFVASHASQIVLDWLYSAMHITWL